MVSTPWWLNLMDICLFFNLPSYVNLQLKMFAFLPLQRIFRTQEPMLKQFMEKNGSNWCPVDHQILGHHQMKTKPKEPLANSKETIVLHSHPNLLCHFSTLTFKYYEIEF
uniref:Uncharacterized protein n=1 Tax=Pyxicephalus adspersus TaxID=30357 RepID=A0AAV3A7V6_PYXAD|nr:TPA: hypothetical protein GDO54_011433 [Pyxicephalus adspersus]